MNKKLGAAMALFLPLMACGKPSHHTQTRKTFHTSSGLFYQQDDTGSWYLLYALSANGSPTPVISGSRNPPASAYPVASRAPSKDELEDAEETEEDEASSEETESGDEEAGGGDESGSDAGGDAGGGE